MFERQLQARCLLCRSYWRSTCRAKSGLVPMISEALITEFKEVVESDLGITLTQQQASEALHNLTGYFDLLAQLQHRQLQGKE